MDVKQEKMLAKLDGFESLRRHHLAKQEIRERQLSLLPVVEGAEILDIGCGPGLYLDYWLRRTEEARARFTCLDISVAALAACQQIAVAAGFSERVETLVGDFFKLDLGKRFDLIFIGNTIEYIADPTTWIKEQIYPRLKPDGVFAVRDLDCGILGCNLVDPYLNSRIVAARIAGCQTVSTSLKYHNPFVGRDLRRILQRAGLQDINAHYFPCEFVAPLNEAQKDYLSQLHTSWYVEDVAGVLSEADRASWHRHFDLTDPECVLNQPGFHYVESEFLAYGRKP